jgi:hypothetical protein
MKELIKSKFAIILFLGILISGFSVQESKACEIDFEIVKGEKEKYEAGDIIVLMVKVKLTHRTCPEGIKKTKFKMNGLKVVGATDWKQTSAMEFERKLKVKVIGTKDGKLIFNAVRTCDKDGGFGSLKLEAIPTVSATDATKTE